MRARNLAAMKRDFLKKSGMLLWGNLVRSQKTGVSMLEQFIVSEYFRILTTEFWLLTPEVITEGC